MNKSKKPLITFILLIAILTSVVMFKSTNGGNNKIEVNASNKIKIDDETLNQIKELNEKLDKYWLEGWNDNKFLSFYSYIANYDEKELTLEDFEKYMNYEIPKNLKNINVHLVKPKSLKPYLNENILDDGLEILTMFTAVPTKDGVYISSKLDKGGIITDAQYKEFVLNHSWIHGDVITPEKDSTQYKQILDAVAKKDENLKNGNVKYIACDEKYANIVISSANDPYYLKEFNLERKEEGYEVIVEELEQFDDKIYSNYAYTDFNLDLLPKYEIEAYAPIDPDYSSSILEGLVEKNYVDKDEKLSYFCGYGNFIYMEFETGRKLLLNNNNSTFDVTEVDNFKTALAQMLKIEQNPPIFILKFE